MAHHSALAVVAQSVAALLDDACRAEFPTGECSLVGAGTLAGMANAQPPAPPVLGVTIFPYRVAYNAQRRGTVPRVNASGERFRPSLLVDLHLLVSAWARTATDQLRLLAWAARTLEDTPLLPAAYLNRVALGGRVVFEPSETVDLAAEPLSLQDLVSIWEVNKPRQQPSLGYVARMIAIDSEVHMPDASLVRTRVFDPGVLVQS